MPELVPLLNKETIEKKVAAAADRISSDYNGREVIMIGVLKGSVIFISDLIRHLTIPVKIDFIGVSSYGSDDSPSEKIRLTKEVQIDIENKDVIIVEDIVDTGLTLSWLIDRLSSLGLRSLKVCTFLDKRERRKADVMIDYSCHVVDKGFIVGYGLDYAENYRNLPDVYCMKF